MIEKARYPNDGIGFEKRNSHCWIVKICLSRLDQIRHRFRHCGGINLQTELERLFRGKAGTNAAQLFSLNSQVELHGTALELLAAERVEPKRAHPFREHPIGAFSH